MGKIGFYLFGRLIAYYGLMIVIGILVNVPIAYYQTKRSRLSMNDFVIICSISGLFGIIGAKLLYLFTIRKNINFSQLTDLNYISSLMSGGFVFLGGVLGVVLALVFCEKIVHIPVRPYIRSCIACLPIGHGFGRIGCFLVGCCYGIPYTGPFSVVYTYSSFAPCGVGLFPVQLAEAVIEWILGICLLVFNRKLKGESGLFIYLAGYSTARFFLEFLRYDEVRGKIAGISTSQLISIFLLLSSLAGLIKDTMMQRRPDAETGQ